MSIVEISAVIEMIEDHFSSGWGGSHVLTVGGVAGTHIFKNAIHACMKSNNFTKILVVDGCQDYIGLLRNPVVNYKYYLELFRTVPVPSIEQHMNPLKPFLVSDPTEYVVQIEDRAICVYDAIIINNAHLIPYSHLKAFETYFPGKILMIVDPLDLDGVDYAGIPTLYDSLSKQSSTIALARSMFGIDSRGIDRKVRCSFRKAKMNKRGIGKIDTNQYVTNSPNILAQINDKQYRAPFRRNQKFIVSSDQIELREDLEHRIITIGPKTLLHISTVSKPMMKLRIHSSPSEFYSILSYTNAKNHVYVKPANILSVDDAVHHRFQSIVLVLGDEPMTNRLWYSLLKIANNITVVEY